MAIITNGKEGMVTPPSHGWVAPAMVHRRLACSHSEAGRADMQVVIPNGNLDAALQQGSPTDSLPASTRWTMCRRTR